jgi:hypothetical protein
MKPLQKITTEIVAISLKIRNLVLLIRMFEGLALNCIF